MALRRARHEPDEGRRVDVTIEAVGVPATFDICQAILAPGLRHRRSWQAGRLRLEKLWDRNIAITTRLVDTAATSCRLVRKLHRPAPDAPFALGDIMKGIRHVRQCGAERAQGRAHDAAEAIQRSVMPTHAVVWIDHKKLVSSTSIGLTGETTVLAPAPHPPASKRTW
jgi:hypothetical protein